MPPQDARAVCGGQEEEPLHCLHRRGGVQARRTMFGTGAPLGHNGPAESQHNDTPGAQGVIVMKKKRSPRQRRRWVRKLHRNPPPLSFFSLPTTLLLLLSCLSPRPRASDRRDWGQPQALGEPHAQDAQPAAGGDGRLRGACARVCVCAHGMGLPRMGVGLCALAVQCDARIYACIRSARAFCPGRASRASLAWRPPAIRCLGGTSSA